MSDDVTARDRVWATLVRLQSTKFTVEDIRKQLPTTNEQFRYGSDTADTSVSDDTIKRVLRAATELDLLEHESGSKYYEKKMRLEVEKNW